MLKMRTQCGNCKNKLDERSPIFICSYECTYCNTCTQNMKHVCPKCDGNLTERPVRKNKPLGVASYQIKRKLKMGMDTYSSN